MSVEEEADWRRFFMIFGPVGDERLDLHFAYLRWMIARQSGDNAPIEEHMLKFDYRKHFPKDPQAELEEILKNQEADIAKVMALKSRLMG